MEQSPSWEADSHSARLEIPLMLQNPRVPYRVHTSSPLVTILGQINLVLNFPPSFLNIHSNITLSSTPESSK
jgi:hypothetical protein